MIYTFEAYELDTYRYELRHHGKLQHVEPKVFDLLTLFVQHPGHTITKNTLLERLWGSQSVSEAALTYCIRAARQALGDTGRIQRTIKTVHGRGFRFLPAVTRRQEITASPNVPPPERPGTFSPPGESLVLAGERRQLTVLFCRIIPTASATASLDPEEGYELLRTAQRECLRVIEHFDGYVAQYLGDGLMVCFGYPLAHEDNARRAVHSALQLIDTLKQHGPLLSPQRHVLFTVSAGIHTGIAIMDGGMSQPTFGSLPNIATQLQGIAEAGKVLVSAATYPLIERTFFCQNLGAYILEEPTRPLEVYQVLQARPPSSLFDPAIRPHRAPLIGREQELGYILERWQQAREGYGQIVLVSGEAGIGKSRLLQALTEHMQPETYRRFEYRCSSYDRHSALYPVIEQWQRWLQWEQSDTPADKYHKLEKALESYHFAGEDVLPLFAAFLSLPLPAPYKPLALAPQQYKKRLLEALLLWLFQEAEKQPVCMIVEDIHWIDPSTLEWLTLLIQQAPTARLLLLLTFRPDFRAPWVVRPPVSHITLGRFGLTQVEAMIAQYTGGKTLPKDITDFLACQTDGVPLFIEEMTRMILLSGMLKDQGGAYELSGTLPPRAIPPTLHDSLMARLDRLGTAKQVAQVGATLGREFSYSLLHQVTALPEALLQHELDCLVDAGLLYQRGLPPHAQYHFKHVLLQEAAYQSLLRSTKQHYHAQAARALAQHFPEMRQTRPELLAYHYTEAGMSAQAIPYWQQASQHAMERSAHLEALAHVRQGMALLAELPETPERLQYALTLQTTLGVALTATRGYAAPEVEEVYLRAHELCLQGGDLPQLFTVLRGLWLFYLVRGALQTAEELGQKLLQIAQKSASSVLLIEAHRALGTSFFFRGEFELSEHHLAQALARYDLPQHPTLVLQYGLDAGAVCLAYSAWTLWLRGYPQQALAKITEALRLTQSLAHPFTRGMVYIFAAMLYQCHNDHTTVQEYATASSNLGKEYEFPIFVALGTTLQGWAHAVPGNSAEGLAQLLQGMASYRDTGAELIRSYMLALLTEVYRREHRHEQGCQTLAQAFAVVENNEERFWEAELHRLKAELWLQQASPDEAQGEVSLQRALEISRKQQAKSLELRVVMSLCRLWQRQHKFLQAQQLLERTYSWFTEGFDTADLMAARALLQELQHEIAIL